MRGFIILCLFLGTGLIAGPLLMDQKGYVLIAMGNWTIEMSVVSLALTLVSMYVMVLLLKWLVGRLNLLRKGSGQWFRARGPRSRQRLATALSALDLKHHTLATKQLTGLDHHYFEGISLMALARCAQQQNHTEQAAKYWQQATHFDKSATAAHAHLADHYLQQGNTEQAEQHLKHIADKDQNWPNIIELQLLLLAQLNRWDGIKYTLKRHRKTMSKERLEYWQHACSEGELAEVASKQGALELKQNWQQRSRGERKDVATQAAYVEQLIGQNMHQEAENALVDYQKKGPQPLLLPLFKALRLPQPVASIKQLEGWLKQDENNPELLSVLGHLALTSRDEVLAEKALSSALKLRQNRQDLLALAQVKEQQGQTEQALQLHKKITITGSESE